MKYRMTDTGIEGRMPDHSWKPFECPGDYIVAWYEAMKEWLKEA